MLITPYYYPNIEYFGQIYPQNELEIASNELFWKQTYRNRCYILGPNKVQRLVVPVHAKSGKSLMKDVEIAYRENWMQVHLRSLDAAYRKSPFYEHYADRILEPIQKKHKFLLDLNIEILSEVLAILGLQKSICQVEGSNLGLKSASNRLNGGLVSSNSFSVYIQNFGKSFVPNLSILDLIFCCGPDSLLYLNKNQQL